MPAASGRGIARTVILGTLGAVLATTAALAAGESSGGGGGGGGNGMLFTNPPAAQQQPATDQGSGAQPRKKTTRGTPVCGVGFVMQKGSCVRLKAGVLSDDELYEQGRALALAGFHAHARPILDAVEREDLARVWTMRGYTLRKLGRFDEGMALYEKALAIDPDNLDTHEYKGEAFVTIGALDKARAELAIVERLCGRSCEQYEDLAEAIETGKDED